MVDAIAMMEHTGYWRKVTRGQRHPNRQPKDRQETLLSRATEAFDIPFTCVAS